jgi:hypothetical protein
MLYHLSIHHPKPEHERDVVDSMHRFGEAARPKTAWSRSTREGPTERRPRRVRRLGER